jgi:hypothetical protein
MAIPAQFQEEYKQWQTYNPQGSESDFKKDLGIKYQEDSSGYGGQWVRSGGMMTDPETGHVIPSSVYEARERNKEYERHVARLAEQGMNPDGTPMTPEYETWLDPETGMLKDQYKINLDELLLDPSAMAGYSAMQEEATREGPSKWADLAMEKSQVEEAALRDAAMRQAMSAEAQARSGAAMRGGLTGGASGVIGRDIGREMLRQRQETARQGQLGRLGILGEDEKNRLNMLGTFAGLESDVGKFNVGMQAKAQEFDITRALEEKRLAHQSELDAWKQEMANIAAEKQASATEKAGGGGK